MQLMSRILKKIQNKGKKQLIKWCAPLRRKSLKRCDFTIISNNCWAGDVYRFFGLPYQTPTVGLYFWADDYIRFIKNLKHYLSCDIQFIELEESKYRDEIIRKGQENKILAKLDDVELVFLHYTTREEAEEKWKRRTERVNYENLFIKNSRQNLCDENNIKDFAEFQYEKKLFFDNRYSDYEFSVYIKGYENSDYIKDDISSYRKYLNITKFLNDGVVMKS